MALLAVADIEAATLCAWPALQLAHDRLWLWRGARGYTKRANAIHCLDPGDDANADERLAKMAALSRYNEVPPMFRVTPLTGPGVTAALDRAGWEAFEPTLVLGMAMPETDLPVATAFQFHDPRGREWLDAQSELSGLDAETRALLEAILGVTACENCGVLIHDDAGRPVAAALATVANGIGVYLNVVTRASARGQGFGRAVMSAALNWTRQAGATTAIVQVVASNAPAIGLYRSLGFTDAYSYHYRRPV